MNFDSLNKWLTLLANVGVVVGIFALIAELNQSSRLAQVNAFQNRMTEMQEAQTQLAMSEDLVEALNKLSDQGVESLNANELRRVTAWYSGVLSRMQGQYYQYQQGFLDRPSIDITLDQIASSTYEQWKALGLLRSIALPEWRAEIELRLSSESQQ